MPNLTDDERRLLLAGLMEYGGPGAGAAALAPLVDARALNQILLPYLRGSPLAGDCA